MAIEAARHDFARPAAAVAAVADAGAVAVADEAAERRRLRWLAFWFYLGVPLALGFLLGWLQVGRAADWPRAVSLFYWVGVSLLMTPLNAIGTAVLAPLLRRVASPLFLTLFAGQLLAGHLLIDPVLRGYRALLQAGVYAELPLTATTSLADFLQRMPSNTLLWVGINLLFYYGLRMPRFGYAAPGPASTPEPPVGHEPPVAGPLHVLEPCPVLMERVRPERRGALLALKADGHYLHVHTDAGSDLIIYRLSDAIRELPPEQGTQVHRSWWVAARAVGAERHRDHLSLVNGLDVPVSRSFRLAARQRGWLASTDR
jgi:hypothetical protein